MSEPTINLFDGSERPAPPEIAEALIELGRAAKGELASLTDAVRRVCEAHADGE